MVVNKIVKVIMAGIIAFLCLNIFCSIYYNIPVHITSKIKATDYIWEKYAYYSKMTEGFGYGKMNNEGFNNLEDYNAQGINILLMGSSHMEGANVPQKKTTAALLNKSFNGSKYVYNIGISGHDFPHIINNLETAIKQYSPQEYVIIEIGSIAFNIQTLEDCINSNVKRIPSYDNKIMFYLQKIPYLRLLYSQYKYSTGNNVDDVSDTVPVVFDNEKYLMTLDKVMEKLKQISINNNIGIIVFYHPHFVSSKNNFFIPNANNVYLTIFENSCRKNGIYFINMEYTFTEEYKNNHTLPHGFSNTAVGTGHLNENGHKIIAAELFRRITILTKKEQ